MVIEVATVSETTMFSPNAANWSLEEAQRKARDHLTNRDRSLQSPPQSHNVGHTPIMRRSTNSFDVLRDSPRTPEELKLRLEQESYSEHIRQRSSPGWCFQRGRRSAPVLQLATEISPAKNNNVQNNDDDSGEPHVNRSTLEVAEENLHKKVAMKSVAEEHEVREVHDRVDQQVQAEHQNRMKVWIDMHKQLNALMAKRREQIRCQTLQRRQEMLDKARKDREMLLRLHKMLAENIVSSKSAIKQRSQEIFRLAEKAKEDEEELEKQRRLEKEMAASRSRIDELSKKIEQSIADVQQDTSIARKFKAKLLEVKTSLQKARLGGDLKSVADAAVVQMQAILGEYDRELKEQAAREARQKEVEAQQKANEEKKEANDDLYVQAVQRLKEAGERRKEFVETQAQQRKDILRVVQLTVNKIQVNTNNMQHALVLIKLFSREEVSIGVSNSATIRLGDHKEALNFAMHLTSERLLGNVEKLPFTSIKEWIPYAIVIATIWSASPKFGEIFFDHLISRCPFLVPVYFSNLEPDEAREYVETFVHNKQEDHSRFVARMGVYARLLGVIMCQKPRWSRPFPPD